LTARQVRSRNLIRL